MGVSPAWELICEPVLCYLVYLLDAGQQQSRNRRHTECEDLIQRSLNCFENGDCGA